MASLEELESALQEDVEPLIALLDQDLTAEDADEVRNRAKAAISESLADLMDFKDDLPTGDPAKRKVVRAIVRLQSARAALRAAQVDAIAHRMQQQIDDIAAARDDVRERVKTIKTVQQAMDLITTLLGLVALFA